MAFYKLTKAAEALETLLMDGYDRGPTALTLQRKFLNLEAVMREEEETNFSLLNVVTDKQEEEVHTSYEVVQDKNKSATK